MLNNSFLSDFSIDGRSHCFLFAHLFIFLLAQRKVNIRNECVADSAFSCVFFFFPLGLFVSFRFFSFLVLVREHMGSRVFHIVNVHIICTMYDYNFIRKFYTYHMRIEAYLYAACIYKHAYISLLRNGKVRSSVRFIKSKWLSLLSITHMLSN